MVWENTYPRAWFGPPTAPDEFSAQILMVVKYAGEGITYKDAVWQINELVKLRDDGNKRKDKKGS